MQTVIHPIPPLFNGKSRILILGTMPSPVSRERSFFYMHTTNRFWPVLAALFSEPLTYANNGMLINAPNNEHPDIPAAVRERMNLAQNHGIALWDVLAQCDISGAEDHSIRNPVVNDFTDILARSSISKIYCTGKTAYQLYHKYAAITIKTGTGTNIPAVCLPSTSAANRGRWPFEKLTEAYAVIKLP
jgi:double-stranded uracil-DNA glycosylase